MKKLIIITFLCNTVFSVTSAKSLNRDSLLLEFKKKNTEQKKEMVYEYATKINQDSIKLLILSALKD